MSSEAKVGATAIVGLSLLVTIVLYLSGINFGTSSYPVNAVFSHVNGLKEGNTVSYAGVYIGTVRSIGIMPDGIRVEMLIDKRIRIPRDSRFTIASSGILGEQYINVIPNIRSLEYDEYMSPNDTVRGEPPFGLDSLMQVSNEAMHEVRDVINSLNEILSDKDVQASLKETIISIDKLTATLSEMAADNQQNINMTVNNLAVMSEDLRLVMRRIDRMTASFDNNGRTAGDMRDLIGNLNSVSMRLDNMAASLEGVVADPETVQDLKAIIGNAREVSEKANEMVSKASITTDADLEMLYDFKESKYVGNVYLRVGNRSSQSFGIIGFSGIGGDNKFNLQYGRDVSRWTERMGIIDGKIGLGADVALREDLKLSLDLYDPNDVKYKLRAKYQILPDLAIIGQTDKNRERPYSRHNSLGLQRTF